MTIAMSERTPGTGREGRKLFKIAVMVCIAIVLIYMIGWFICEWLGYYMHTWGSYGVLSLPSHWLLWNAPVEVIAPGLIRHFDEYCDETEAELKNEPYLHGVISLFDSFGECRLYENPHEINFLVDSTDERMHIYGVKMHISQTELSLDQLRQYLKSPHSEIRYYAARRLTWTSGNLTDLPEDGSPRESKKARHIRRWLADLMRDDSSAAVRKLISDSICRDYSAAFHLDVPFWLTAVEGALKSERHPLVAAALAGLKDRLLTKVDGHLRGYAAGGLSREFELLLSSEVQEERLIISELLLTCYLPLIQDEFYSLYAVIPELQKALARERDRTVRDGIREVLEAYRKAADALSSDSPRPALPITP